MSPVPPTGRPEEAALPPALRGTISRILRLGLLVSGAFLAIAVAGFLAEGIGLGPAAAAVGLRAGFADSLLSGDPRGFAFAGLLVLLATPLTRVVASIALFTASGDRAFARLALFVLLLLGATIVVGVIR
jgi:uncharacterized membrane protein